MREEARGARVNNGQSARSPADAPTDGEGQSVGDATHTDVQKRSPRPPYSWDPGLRGCTQLWLQEEGTAGEYSSLIL